MGFRNEWIVLDVSSGKIVAYGEDGSSKCGAPRSVINLMRNE